MDKAGGNKRIDRVRAAVFAATQDELVDHGYDGLSVEGSRAAPAFRSTWSQSAGPTQTR